MEVSVGLDIGGTNTVIGIVDPEGNILKEKTISTKAYPEVEDYVTSAHEQIEEALSELDGAVRLKGIGIGAPNGNYYRGTIEQAPNLLWDGIVPLADLFKNYYDLPVIVTNDANAAAIGEMMFGAAKGMDDFIVITLGTGLGSGIVVNGDLVYGNDGFAGEMGHTTVRPGGRICGCGKRGCLETYASAPGLKRTVFELIAETNKDGLLSGLSFGELDAKLISEAADKGDEIAKRAYDFTGQILGQALADATAYLSPEAVFFFGGLSRAGNWIMEPTKKYFEQSVLGIFKNKVKLDLSALNERNGAILGAAALVWKEEA